MILKLKYLTVLVLGATLVILSLIHLFNTPDKKNGFNRKFLRQEIHTLNRVSSPLSIDRIAGVDERFVYFINNIKQKVLYTDLNLSKTPKPLGEIEKIHSGTGFIYNAMIDDDYIYLFCNNYPSSIYCYDRISKTLILDHPSEGFTRCIALSPGNYVVRKPDSSGTDQLFANFYFVDGWEKQRAYFRTPQIGDGGFATDGDLYYDRGNHLIFYTYFYQNKFICLDTNLRLLYTGHTIDTVSNSKVRGIKRIGRSENYYTLSTPPHFVNGQTRTNRKYLYIESMLKADNEMTTLFNKNSVIDRYSILNHTYAGSFYIPFFEGKRMNDFVIEDQCIYVVYGKEIVSYILPYE
jgi:hypothetical protein